MKIAYFEEKFPYASLANEQEVYPYGGGVVVAYYLAVNMAKRGNEVYFFTTSIDRQGSHEEWQGVRISRYGTWFKIFRRNVSPDLVVKPDADVDIIHAHISSEPLPLIAALRYTGRKRLPLVVTYHGDVIGTRKNPAYLAAIHFANLVIRKALNRAEVIIVPSDSLIDRSIILPRYRSKTIVIPNGIDLETFDIKATKESCRERLSLPPQANILLFMGGLHPKKGPDILLQAMTRVFNTFPETYLVMAGSGVMREQLERMAAQSGLAGKVRFVGYVSDEESKYRYYKAADIFALPSTTTGESFGLVNLEAMAAGTPIVASNIGGVSSVVRDGETGLLVPPRDATALSEAIIKLLGDRDLRRKMAETGQEVVKNYSWDKIVGKTQELYERVIGGLGKSSHGGSRKGDGQP